MDIFDLFAKISLDTTEYENGLTKAEQSGSSFGGKIKTALGTAGKIGAAAIGAATTAVTAFAGASVAAGSSFDSSMSQVAATMGTTVDSIENLREFAQQMGSTTAFSASQAADALNYMALAGYDAEQSMQALPNVLNLAAAGGIELATASDMVTDAQSALGLSMEESAELVDKMAMASSKSNTSVAQLGDAILTVGGTAKNLSGGTTELATALGILADNGIKGAEGGTALRNILNSLSAPTDKAAGMMEELGVSVFDAEGNMRSMNDIFLDLGASMADMTQEGRMNVISTLFNARDMKSAEALLANVGDRWQELSGYIDDAQGSAEKMANTQLDNLAGDITLFKSALEGAQIAVSDGLTPTLREFVQFGSEGLSRLTEAFKEGGLSGAMGAFGEILSDGLGMIVEFVPEMITAGGELLKAFGQGLIDNLPLMVESALQVVLSLANGISESLPELVPTIVDVVIKIVETLVNNVDLLVEASVKIIVALAQGIINALPQLLKKAPEIIKSFANAIIQALPTILNSGVQLLSTFVQGIASALGKVRDIGKQIIDTIKNAITGVVSSALQWGKDLIENFKSGISSKVSSLGSVVSNAAKVVKNFLGFSEPKEGPLSDFHTYAPDMMALFAKGVTDNTKVVTDSISKAFDFDGMFAAPNMTGTAGAGNTMAASGGNMGHREPITIIVKNMLDGREISETVLRYQNNMAVAYGR